MADPLGARLLGPVGFSYGLLGFHEYYWVLLGSIASWLILT